MNETSRTKMTPREKQMLEALKQIARGPDCSRFCALIARKQIQKMQQDRVEEIVVKNEQAVEVFNEVFGKRE